MVGFLQARYRWRGHVAEVYGNDYMTGVCMTGDIRPVTYYCPSPKSTLSICTVKILSVQNFFVSFIPQGTLSSV